MTGLMRLLALFAVMSIACSDGTAVADGGGFHAFGPIAKYEKGITAAFFRALKFEGFLLHKQAPSACIHVSDEVSDEQVRGPFLAAASAIASEEESGFRIGPEICEGSLAIEVSLDSSVVGMDEACEPDCIELLEPTASQTDLADGQSGVFWIRVKKLGLSSTRAFYFSVLPHRLHRLEAWSMSIVFGLN